MRMNSDNNKKVNNEYLLEEPNRAKSPSDYGKTRNISVNRISWRRCGHMANHVIIALSVYLFLIISPEGIVEYFECI